MISHHSSTGSKVIALCPDSALLLEAFRSADSDFVWDSRMGRQSSRATAQKVWKAWGAKLVRLSSLGGKNVGFPSRVSRRMGPLCLSSLLLCAELWFVLREVIWDAQALFSCQEIVVSGLPAIISLSHPFPHWWRVSTFWALFQLLSDFSGVQTDFFGLIPLQKRTAEGAQAGGVSNPDANTVLGKSAKMRWLQAGKGLWGIKIQCTSTGFWICFGKCANKTVSL